MMGCYLIFMNKECILILISRASYSPSMRLLLAWILEFVLLFLYFMNLQNAILSSFCENTLEYMKINSPKSFHCCQLAVIGSFIGITIYQLHIFLYIDIGLVPQQKRNRYRYIHLARNAYLYKINASKCTELHFPALKCCYCCLKCLPVALSGLWTAYCKWVLC